MSIHPQIIEKEGKKEFVVLPYDEFLAIQDVLEDYEDLKDLREAKKEFGTEKTVSIAEARSELLGD
jgi:PHD/YefM family antitoxin component YafN of YafNO toxin-antitoxin module